jgi:hypothetical protein
MSRSFYSASLVTLCATSALALFACAPSREVTYTSKDGQGKVTFQEGNASVPKDFPLPIYEKGKVNVGMTTTSTSAQGGTQSIFIETSDSPAQAGNFYQSKLPSEGWTIESTNTMGSMIHMMAKKGNIQAQIVINKDETKPDGKTSIMLNATTSTNTSSSSSPAPQPVPTEVPQNSDAPQSSTEPQQ